MLTIVHIACINLSYETGMGRIASKWRDAFEQHGHQFIHIGRKEVNKTTHANLWGFSAKKFFLKLGIRADILLVHEPYGGFFDSTPNTKLVVYSHGIEERAWQVNTKFKFEHINFKSKLFLPQIRFYQNNRGFKKANLILLSNSTDKAYLAKKNIQEEKIWVFKNGYEPYKIEKTTQQKTSILFNATWINRKGIHLMYEVLNKLLPKYTNAYLVLAGTVFNKNIVLKNFHPSIHKQITVIPSFSIKEEKELYANNNIFVMPSFYEGQSVALTQALAMGLCVIAADNCGQKDFIENNENGLLFETGNATAFLNAIEIAITDKKLQQSLSQKGEQFAKHFTWDYVTKEIVEKIVSN